MPAYYHVNTSSLSKLAHHTAMAEVHGELSAQHYAEIQNPESRNSSFHEAALAHHRKEISYNENQAREYKGGRQFSSASSGPSAMPDDDHVIPKRNHSNVYTFNGRMMSRIPQQREFNTKIWRDQGHEEDIRNAGGNVPVDPSLGKRRFI